jgi:hypothetical protein
MERALAFAGFLVFIAFAIAIIIGIVGNGVMTIHNIIEVVVH